MKENIDNVIGINATYEISITFKLSKNRRNRFYNNLKRIKNKINE
jgi:hypothetical protein